MNFILQIHMLNLHVGQDGCLIIGLMVHLLLNSYIESNELFSAFVFTTQILQSLDFLNPKFQVSSHFQWLHSPVCVGFLELRLKLWSLSQKPRGRGNPPNRNHKIMSNTVMTLSFCTDRSGQTVQTQIRLLLYRVFTVCYSLLTK